MLALLRRASFWPPSVVYISVINTQTFQVTFLHVNQLLFSLKNSCPCRDFEPGTSPVPSRYGTNWSILAWMLYISTRLWVLRTPNTGRNSIKNSTSIWVLSTQTLNFVKILLQISCFLQLFVMKKAKNDYFDQLVEIYNTWITTPKLS